MRKIKSRIAILLLGATILGNRNTQCVAQLNLRGNLLNHQWGWVAVGNFYRSYTSCYLTLRDSPVNVYQDNEWALYADLAQKAFYPTHALTELTLYPVAGATGWLKTEKAGVFRRFNLTPELNLLSSIAGSQQEPWSVSLFLGQLANFIAMTDEEELQIAATGAAGFVATTGWQQIFDNYLVPSRWWRLEWKLKGAGNDGRNQHVWDIKIGYRWYNLRQVNDALSLTYSRTRTEKGRHSWQIRHNSITEIELQIPPAEFSMGFSRILVVYGKYFPVRNRLVGLKIGYSYERRREYRGAATGFTPESRTLQGILLQPLMLF